MKKKILVDIDVVAVAEHYVNDRDYKIAKAFAKRITSGEFEVYTTHALLDLVKAWDNVAIKEKILLFYKSYFYVIPAAEIEAKSSERSIKLEGIVEKLSKKGVKPEDAILAVITSLFSLSLVTLNRKHLRNRRSEINEILKRNGLNEIRILLPNEI
ncbi:MAG: hypothetical protein HYT73_02150 [Candidatus Aenigmarchaeota archaeon]|nr:hypothetical protein [Candidatus Aenigmarchaeota archaeon]